MKKTNFKHHQNPSKVMVIFTIALLASLASTKSRIPITEYQSYTSNYSKALTGMDTNQPDNKGTTALVVIKTPHRCQFSEDSDQVVLTKDSLGREYEDGGRLGGRFKEFFGSKILSFSNIYSMAANTTCHYQSTFSYLQGILSSAQSPQNHQKGKKKRKNKIKNKNHLTALDGVFPVGIHTDYSDTLFQLRACPEFKPEIGSQSFQLIANYSKSKPVKWAIQQLLDKNKWISELSEHLHSLYNIEALYGIIHLDKSSKGLDLESKVILDQLYLLYMLGRYFSSPRSTISFLKPFFIKVERLLHKYKLREKSEGELIRERRKLLVFTVSNKIMVGMKNKFLGLTHEKIYKNLESVYNLETVEAKKKNMNQKTLQKMKNQMIENFDQIEPGSDFLLKIRRANIKEVNLNLVQREVKNFRISPYSRKDKLYSVEGYFKGKREHICGPYVQGECLLVDLITYMMIDLFSVEANTCKIKEAIQQDEDDLIASLDRDWPGDIFKMVIVVIFSAILMVWVKIGKIQKELDLEYQKSARGSWRSLDGDGGKGGLGGTTLELSGRTGLEFIEGSKNEEHEEEDILGLHSESEITQPPPGSLLFGQDSVSETKMSIQKKEYPETVDFMDDDDDDELEIL